MSDIVVDDLQDGYVEIVRRVLKDGAEVSPRGQRTKELVGASFTLTNPSRSIPVGIGRGVRKEIGAAESAQLIAGFSSGEQLVAAGPNFAHFMQYDRMYGAYGPRTYAQGAEVVRLLVQDPDTRQAALTIWRPDELVLGSKDVPCTQVLWFAIRDDKLDLNVTMRSNDVLWGLTFDAWMFTAIQSAMAYALGIPMGVYRHFASSLHAYVDRDESRFDALHAYREGEEEHPPLPFVQIKSDASRELQACLQRWAHVRNTMEAAAGARVWAPTHNAHPNAVWYRDVLGPLGGPGRLCPCCRYALPEKYFFVREHNVACCRWCEVDRRHKLPIGTYSRMMLAQSGACAICGGEEQTLNLDHSRETGAARGLLCPACNRGLGQFGDDANRVLRAAHYLNADVDENDWTADFGFLYRARPRDGRIAVRG